MSAERQCEAGTYHILLQQSGFDAADMLFVYDHRKNRVAARAFGIETAPFETAAGFTPQLQQLDSKLRACRKST